MSDIQSVVQWFYEERGQRKGPFSEDQIVELIKTSIITRGVSVWKQGFPDWLKVESTELGQHLDSSTPPPLSGEHINNTVIWILAFAPIIGYVIEWVVSYGINQGNDLSAARDMEAGKYWYVSIILSIGLSLLDENLLKKAGHNTSKFKGWVWLVPVYIYQRAKATKQNLAYFTVWIVSFLITIFI
ncbi:DUF4339 domain-containing protein [Castellaniella sp.]|uniref:DUF4339 domain-containing protein n=1 Tax=Castellaniella sp. TaxID=1955812 RepID=UPI002AFF022A|nr:DUF4339 domain-containing protein [Castellaniella sp.]